MGGKDKLIQPLAIALELGLPVYIVYDADGNITREDHRNKHERDNRAILSLLDAKHDPFPTNNISENNYTIWHHNLTEAVKNDFGTSYQQLTDAARVHYAQEAGLEKNDLFIAEWLSLARGQGLSSTSLRTLCESILRFSNEIYN